MLATMPPRYCHFGKQLGEIKYQSPDISTPVLGAEKRLKCKKLGPTSKYLVGGDGLQGHG